MTRPRRVVARLLAVVAALAGVHRLTGARANSPGDAPATPPAISGTVTAVGHDRQPARQALVMIAGTDVGVVRVTATDDKGRFAFAAVPDGHYLVAADLPGYLTAMYGAARPGQPGDAVEVTAGAPLTVSLMLLRGAVLTGRVIDEGGHPIVGSRVRALPRRPLGDDLALGGDAGDPAVVTTDDAGAYRFFDVPPGTYVIGAPARGLTTSDARLPTAAINALESTAPPAAVAGASVGYAPAFYPSARDVANASVVTVGPGEELSGLDIGVRAVRFSRIDGTLGGATIAVPYQITLRPRGWHQSGALLFTQATHADADGHFAFTNVPPGEYTILARTQAPPPDPLAPPDRPAPMFALADLTVGDADQHVALTWQPGLTISGRVIFDGLAAPPTDITVRVGLRATPASNGPATPSPAAIDAEGRFTLTGIMPGSYWLVVTVPASPVTQVPDWISGSAIVNGRDAFDQAIALGPAAMPADLVVTLTRQTQQIDGVVRDASHHAAPNATVVAFSTDPRFWFPQSRRVAVRQTSEAGDLLFNVAAALPPGEYFLAATPTLAPGEQFDPAYLTELAAHAARTRVAAGGSVSVSLTLPRPPR